MKNLSKEELFIKILERLYNVELDDLMYYDDFDEVEEILLEFAKSFQTNLNEILEFIRNLNDPSSELISIAETIEEMEER